MCVSRLRNMVEPLYSNPQKDPSAIEALNSTPVPPPFKIPEVNKEIEEERNKEIKEESTPTVTTEAPVNSKITDNRINESMNNMFESSGWEMVHNEPPVDIFMDEIPPVRYNSDQSTMTHNNKQPNGLLQHETATLDGKSSPSSVSPASAPVRTYTPLSISSEEEGTASEPDSENLEDSTLGLLRPKKKHAFNAPDLFKKAWQPPKKVDNSDALSVRDRCTSFNNICLYNFVYVGCECTQINI